MTPPDDPGSRRQRASGRHVARRTVVLGSLSLSLANLAGAIVVFVLLAFVLPTPDGIDEQRSRILNLILAGAYTGTVAVGGVIFGARQASRRLRWLVEERRPDRHERRLAVRIPLASASRQTALWGLAALLFALVNGLQDVLLGVEVGLTVLIGGLTTSTTSYLLLVHLNRRVVARAYAGRSLHRPPGAGVAWRAVLTWTLGTGLPLAGITLLSGLAIGLDVSRRELAIAVFVLGLTALATGLLTVLQFARGMADPLRALRRSLERIERGDLDVDVPITETTEIGVLQAGVTRMVEGLRERERVRDLFGRHVGEDVARTAIADGVALGGEERFAAALFVDVVDSTGLAEHSSPHAVLELLNSFFAVVVEVVDAHGGVVNKFMGDAVLAVWGAPLAHDDPAGAALAAARVLGERLPVEVTELRAGTGVAAGQVVAGNLGASTRLEYTVIGDPVNVASRLSGMAKDHDPAVLVDRAVLDRADPAEAVRWVDAGEVVLRGRSSPTPLATPA